MSRESESIFDGITRISDEVIEETHTSAVKKPVPFRTKRQRLYTLSAAAAAVVLFLSFILSRGTLRAYAIEEAEYPKEARYTSDDVSMKHFLEVSVPAMLSGAGDKNIVCSPVNVYLSLSALAELTDGNTRQEMLSVLDSGSMEEQRSKANLLWNNLYVNDKRGKTLLASSVWLDKDIRYNEDTMKVLSGNYYASSYRGKMGSNALNRAMGQWISKNTGGKLDNTDGGTNPDTVLALISTVYFKANWDSKFSASDNYTGTFHESSADVPVTFMKQTLKQSTCIWGDRFMAVSQHFETNQTMYYILPDEGYTPEDLLNDPEFQSLISGSLSEGSLKDQCKPMKVHLSVPKFDISSEINLKAGFEKMGIHDVLDDNRADFTPMTDLPGIALEEATNNVRVTINEKGCEAVSYVKFLNGATSAAPIDDEMDFILDRPFIFMITNVSGNPLFLGIVNQP